MINTILVFFLLVFLSFAYLKIANRFNIIDKPNNRSSHKTPTIRGGGILFYLGILIYFVVSGFQYPYFFTGVTLIAIISFIDDIITLSSSFRLPFQFLTIGLCILQLGLDIDFWLLIPLLIVGVGFINIYNFMDGINGITGFYSIITLLTLLFINVNENVVGNNLLIYTLMSLVVFGFYNFRVKARMFAGDIGSISIAVMLFFVIVLFIVALEAPVFILLVVVYGADTLMTMLYRKLFLKEKVTEAHRHHVYQKLVDIKKMPHIKVSLVYTIIQIVVNFLILKTYNKALMIQWVMLISIISFFILFYIIIFKKLKI